MDKTDLLKQITAYQPFDLKETEDQKIIITAFKADEDLVTRANTKHHLCASAWIVNKDRDKILLAYHKIFQSYSWLGGHCDGEWDCLKIALKETQEESGLSRVTTILEDIFAIDVLPVPVHTKNGVVIDEHRHLNLTYLLEADDKDLLTVNVAENEDVRWFDINDYERFIKEKLMIRVYRKLNRKLREIL